MVSNSEAPLVIPSCNTDPVLPHETLFLLIFDSPNSNKSHYLREKNLFLLFNPEIDVLFFSYIFHSCQNFYEVPLIIEPIFLQFFTKGTFGKVVFIKFFCKKIRFCK